MSTVQEMERHVKAPLSNAKSTRDARLALEENGKFAVKTGQSRIAILLFESLPCLSQMIKKQLLYLILNQFFCGLCTLMMGLDHMIHTPPSYDSHMTEWNLISPAAVQMSLHSLAVTFAKEMRSLQLSEEQVTYWNQFMGTRQEHIRR